MRSSSRSAPSLIDLSGLVAGSLHISGYIPWTPTPKQAAWLMLICRDAFYGGAAGGGKSGGLLMAGLQYADLEGYSALILRRTFPSLNQPHALIPMSREWLLGSGARYDGQNHRWHFPAKGTTLTFGYLRNDSDLEQYQGAAYDFIGLDEGSQFTEHQLRYMFSRLRRRAGSKIPPRFRLASNPGGPGHDWIKARYIEPHTVKDRITIRARLEDNPHVDREAYLRSLDELDPITRRQLLDGDWSAKHGGSLFKREWFATKIIREAPTDLSRVVRYWDLAATEAKAGRDPDWTAGALMGLWPGKGVILLDVVRRRESPRGVRSLIRSTAEADAARWGSKLHIAWEEEGGSGGKFASEELARDLAGFSFGPDRKHGGDSKMALAGPVSSQAEAGNIWILAGDWIGDTIDELEAFPQGSHDDRVDSISGAYRKLVAAKTPRLTFIGA